jgi:hypothetical protein
MIYPKLIIFIIREILVNFIGYKMGVRSFLKRSLINNMARKIEVDLYDKGPKHSKNIKDHLHENNIEIKNKNNFLEMGPGGSILHGIHKILDGWNKYIAVDTFPSQIWSKYPQDLYSRFTSELDNNLKNKANEILLSSQNEEGPIFYFGTQGLFNTDFNSKYTAGSIDFIYTWGVLEHIDDPKQVFIKNYELLSDSSYVLHVIDPHPHTWSRLRNPYIFLTIPQWLWNLMYKGRGFINRVRASSYEAWAKQAGFEIISNKKEISNLNISNIINSINETIKYTDINDLLTDRLYLFLKKSSR